MQFNCPVCNKAGLQNYTVNPIICPQCNSDLKPFLLLHSISKPNSNKFVLFSLALVGVVLAILYLNSTSDGKKIANANSEAIIQLQDSIKTLQTTFAKSESVQHENKSSENEIIIQYKVRKGDSPSKIAQFFYNDWRLYKKIEADNKIKQPYILKVGALLILKLKQD